MPRGQVAKKRRRLKQSKETQWASPNQNTKPSLIPGGRADDLVAMSSFCGPPQPCHWGSQPSSPSQASCELAHHPTYPVVETHPFHFSVHQHRVSKNQKGKVPPSPFMLLCQWQSAFTADQFWQNGRKVAMKLNSKTLLNPNGSNDWVLAFSFFSLSLSLLFSTTPHPQCLWEAQYADHELTLQCPVNSWWCTTKHFHQGVCLGACFLSGGQCIACDSVAQFWKTSSASHPCGTEAFQRHGSQLIHSSLETVSHTGKSLTIQQESTDPSVLGQQWITLADTDKQ